MTDESDFITVTTRRYHKSTVKTTHTQPFNPTLAELMDIVSSKLEIYKKEIVGAYIYGSRARGTNRPNSDADIIVFWRHEYDQEFLKSVRASIEEKLGFNIDFVACVFKKKWNGHNDQRDEAYFENVIIDAKPIIGIEPINYLIDHSIKLPKLSR